MSDADAARLRHTAAGQPWRMRAVTIEAFGPPQAMMLRSADDPLLAPDGVLIRVAAAGVNPVDAKIREGAHAEHFPHQFPLIPGWDAAGTVERVGPAVWDLQPGDAVLAYCRKDQVHEGTYAELVSISRDQVAAAGEMDLREAAALPLAGLTAYQCVHDGAEVQPGETVVVRGASGGVGGFAVQVARAAGARVVGIAAASAEAYVRGLGAEAFVDYRRDDAVAELARVAPQPDVLIDLVGGDELAGFAAAVRTGGRICSTLEKVAPEGLREGVRFRYVFVRPDGQQLAALVNLHRAGELEIAIAGRYPLADAASAHERLAEGSMCGKLVLEVAA